MAWYEPKGYGSGKAPIHQAVATRNSLKDTLRNPSVKPIRFRNMLVAVEISEDHRNPHLYCLDIELRETKEGGLEFTSSGHDGELIEESVFEKMIENYWENTDLESDFGHMADEQKIAEGSSARTEYLESVKEELQRDTDYPFERMGDYTINGKYYVATMDSAGQILDSIKPNDVISLIPKADLKFIISTWKKYHLASMRNQKDIPPEDAVKITRIINAYNEGDALEILGKVIRKTQGTKRFESK